MDTQKNTPLIEPLPTLLTIPRVAALAHVSRRTVRRWAAAGKLTPIRQEQSGSSKVLFDTRQVLKALGVEVAE